MTTTKTPAEKAADEAFEATKDFPCFDKQDRFAAMLEHVRVQADDDHADIIKACRQKAGLA